MNARAGWLDGSRTRVLLLGTMARLSLKLLGGFLLRADDRPRALPARKAQALLAYLAVRAGRAHARETLTGLLWGDVGERQARQSLRQTMVRLRRALAANPRALLAQGDTVTLTPAALARLVDELTPLSHVEHVALGALSAPATATLVRALARAGSQAGRLAEIVDRAWDLSEGNPFVIVETMRALRDGRLPDAGGVELPRRVREMIAARIGRLSPRAQELARVASVFTREFEFPVLQRAAALARRETAEAVEELVRRRIFDAVGERFDFTHSRLRHAVYQGLLAPRQQALHAAIGEADVGRHPGVAHHGRGRARSVHPDLQIGASRPRGHAQDGGCQVGLAVSARADQDRQCLLVAG